MGAAGSYDRDVNEGGSTREESLFVPARPIPEPISNQLDNRNAKFVIQS